MNKQQTKTHYRLKKEYKILLIILCVLFAALLISLCAVKILRKPPAVEEGNKYGQIQDISVSGDEDGYYAALKEKTQLNFVVVDCGQASATLIDFGDTEFLIDAGCYNDGDMTVADEIQPYVDDGTLELIIASHSHEDHIGGFSQIFHKFSVKDAIYGELDDTTSWGRIFKNNLASVTGTASEDSNKTIVLGEGCTLTIFDVADGMEDPNANSVVCLLTYGDCKFFVSGDLEENEEVLLRGEDAIKDVHVVVAGHHGSSTSNTLLDILKPDYTVVSCAKENEYFHPHKAFLERAVKYSNCVLGTFKSGTIKFSCDGKKVALADDIKRADRLTVNDAGAE